MAHPKRVINFALFFYALFQYYNQWLRNFICHGQIGTPQDKFGQPLSLIQI